MPYAAAPLQPTPPANPQASAVAMVARTPTYLGRVLKAVPPTGGGGGGGGPGQAGYGF